MRVAPAVSLSEEERSTLTRWSRGRRTQARLVVRAKIVLAAATGRENRDIAQELVVTRRTVGRWRTRFVTERLEGISKDAPRPGRTPTRFRKHEARILKKTVQETPAHATHWSTRTLAKELRISHSLVQRVWKANDLKPHLVRRFKLSNDPHFEDKLRDVIGLYLNPPEHALVLSVDEKSQIQALDRTQPSLPLYKGRLGTLTHDYKRHGTTTLFAALELAEGRVIGTCMPRHRHQEWIKFLKLIDTDTPADLELHLILDNYATHKHPKVQAWLKRHPRFHLHFVPTSCSWLNLIERFFRDLSQRRLRRGVFKSVEELIHAILGYLDHHNNDPKTFVWRAKPDKILAKVARARAALDKSSSD